MKVYRFNEYISETKDNEYKKYLVTVETNTVGTTNRFLFTGTEKEVESFANKKSRENCLYYKNTAIRSIEDIIEEDDVIEQNAKEIQEQEIKDNSIYTIEEYNELLHDKYF